MHVRFISCVALELFSLALGGCVEDLEDEVDTVETSDAAALEQEDDDGDVLGADPVEEALPGTPQDHCDVLANEGSCIDAGCRWQPIFGAAFDEEDICITGELHGLCFAEHLAQPCEPDARRCNDGTYAWVLPGPDDAMLVARSATSCGVPQHFIACPGAPDHLTSNVGSSTPTGGSDLGAFVADACTCACESPAA